MGVACSQYVGVANYMMSCSEDRDPDDVEDLENMLEWHAMQVCSWGILGVMTALLGYL